MSTPGLVGSAGGGKETEARVVGDWVGEVVFAECGVPFHCPMLFLP